MSSPDAVPGEAATGAATMLRVRRPVGDLPRVDDSMRDNA